jgi:hypothetical protein
MDCSIDSVSVAGGIVNADEPIFTLREGKTSRFNAMSVLGITGDILASGKDRRSQ